MVMGIPQARFWDGLSGKPQTKAPQSQQIARMQTRAPPPGSYKLPSFFDAVDQQRQDGMAGMTNRMAFSFFFEKNDAGGGI